MTFEPSLELNAAFYREVVAPLVRPAPHAAALLGWGSDVLGYDTARSADHGWGPRLQIFVNADAVEDVRSAVEAGLPDVFRGWPVRYRLDADDPAVHRVEVTTLGEWLTGRLGVDPRPGLEAIDWLVIPHRRIVADVGSEAAEKLSAAADEHDGERSLNVRLLTDIRDIFSNTTVSFMKVGCAVRAPSPCRGFAVAGYRSQPVQARQASIRVRHPHWP